MILRLAASDPVFVRGRKCSDVVFNQSSERAADVPRASRFAAFYQKIDSSNTTCETKEFHRIAVLIITPR